MLVYSRPTKGKANDAKKAKAKTKPKEGDAPADNHQKARSQSLDHSRDHGHPPLMRSGSVPQPSYQPPIQYYSYPSYPQQQQFVPPPPQPAFYAGPPPQVPYYYSLQPPQPGTSWHNQLQTPSPDGLVWVSGEQSNRYLQDSRHVPNEFFQRGPEFDLIAAKLNSVLTSIDGEIFSGNEEELVIHEQAEVPLRGGWGFSNNRELSRAANNVVTTAVKSPRSTNYFAKVWLYANSRLPPNLPPLKLELSAYQLICLAARYSQSVYSKPTGKERETHVDADWRMGTKAMVIKSIPIDHVNVVVFAIRGSQTFMDWAVNINSAPAPPDDFLDDPGNMCHSGFLSVARKMVRPVGNRLRTLLEEEPSRSSCSLILTGHSAGGAVASLLFVHMLAEIIRSELNILTDCFKRIHCITFGTPPISLLPLRKPDSRLAQKSLFLSFINEGDPVPRADKPYIRSLLDLYTTSPPGASCTPFFFPSVPLTTPKSNFLKLSRPKLQKAHTAPSMPLVIWQLPAGTLSNAGRLVVLRKPASGEEDDVRAVVSTDQQLRTVVFGDPMMHMMKTYARRVEVLATKAVTGKTWA